MSVRDRLAKRERQTATFQLRVDDDSTARVELVAAQEDGDKTRIERAETAVESCYEQLTIRALPPADMEALLAEHPPPEAQKDKKIFDPATFVPAFLAACVDSDITEDDWQDYVTKGPLSQGEVTALFELAWQTNYRTPDPSVPKESTPTHS